MSEWTPYRVWTTTPNPSWRKWNGTDAVLLGQLEDLERAEFLVERIQLVWHWSKLWITDMYGNVVQEWINDGD